VFELGNEDLKALARAHGLNPDAPEYAFGKGVKRTEATATSSGRQQTGRAKLADDVTAQMSDDEKINIGRNARTMESEGTFKGQDVSNTSRAEQARKLFPRLNAEETTGGYGSKNTGVTKEAKDAALKSFNDKATRSNAGFDPSMLKDAAKVAAYHIEAGARSFADFSTKMVEDFGEGIRPYLKDLHTKASEEALGKETAKTSAKDTDHMQAAIKELGPDAKLSDITKRAQEMKDSHAQVAAHNENGGSTFHPTKGDLNGKPAFSVGGEPEFKSPGLKMTTDGKELTTAQRDEFANRHAVKEALDKHKDASIGTWYDKETDKTTTELVKTPTDRAEAIAMGQKNGEKAIYDLGKGEEIKTGGTGEGPATLEAHHWSNTPDLTETDPEKMGTGVRGAERARMNEPGFQKRTNFGTEGYKEPAVQGQKYHYVSDLEASKYYDVQKDADGIWQKGFEEGGATGAEKAVRDAGYHGYRSGNEVASFEKVPVRPHVEAKPEFSMVTDADGKPDRLEITHNGEPVGHLKIEEQVPGTWTIKDAAVKADAQGQGFGKAAHMQAFEEARRAGAKTVESDVSNSSKENGVWESLKRDYPEAITEENGQYSADLSKISEKPQSIGAASAAAMGADKSLNRRPNGTVIESTAAKKLTVHSPAGKSFGDDEHEASFTYGEGGEYKNKAAAMEAAKDMSKVELEDDPKWEGVRGITDEKTATTAKEAKEASQAAAQNVRDEEATKKNKVEIQKLQESLPELAQEHLTQQEKDGITTTATGKPRTVGTAKFLANLAKNTVQYAKDIAMQGAGARKWYSRSTGAFEAIEAEAPNYFKKGDRNTLINFLGSLAGDSPQQAVVSNLRETLSFWKEWVDAGRPDLSLDKWKKFGDIADAAWKEDGSPRVGGREKGASMHWDYAPKGDEWNTENLLLRNLTLPETKVPNMIKAINGEPMWPDLTKNAAFKVPSFRENLIKWLGGKSSGTKHVTNDSWQGLWGDVKKKDLTNPESYHPLSVITRAAAKELGWEPEEAQAAIWSFTQCLTEKGSEDPEVVRHYSEDYADLVGKDGDDEVRSLLEKLGVNHGDLDKRLARLEQKPEIDKNTSRGTPTTADSVRQLRSRIETARGKGAIPEPKSIQGSLFRENPAFEHKSNPGAGHTRTGPTELELIKAEEQAKADKLKAEGELNSPLKKLGSKETPYKDKDTLFNPEEFENESNLGKLGEKKKKSPYGKL
jgi:predicted GNAT family acetyltransferase